MGYKLLGMVVWKSWVRLLGHEKRSARERVRTRRMLIGAGVVLTAVAAGAAVVHAQRDTPQ